MNENNTAIFAFEPDHVVAGRLSEAASVPLYIIQHHRFPDGESLVTLPAAAPPTTVLYASLHDPDARLMPLLLAANAARHSGASRVHLVAPYLPYLRQDKVFSPGQSISAQVLGALLGAAFERIITVDPHLHRIHDLDEVVGEGRGHVLTAAGPIRAFLEVTIPNAYLLGPDEESMQWLRAISQGTHDLQAGTKVRSGDFEVHIELPDPTALRGRNVVIVDDVASSGRTLAAATRAALAANASSVDCVVTHAIFAGHALEVIRQAGAEEIWSTDSIAHPTNRIALARLLRDEVVGG